MTEVSILLPTFSRNKNGMLSKSIESVLAQDFRDFELLVVDDGSSDGSDDTIRRFCALDPRVKHIRFDQNVGLPALTTAEALVQSAGRYIAWQFDDCEWKPDLLSVLHEHSLESGAGVVYGSALVSSTAGMRSLGEAFSRERLLEENYIANCATLIKREVFDRCGWLDPHVLLKRICDYDMWIRASAHFRFSFTDVVVAEEHGGTLADSLGNSVFLSKSLSDEYRSLDRDQFLKIGNRSNWNAFSKPPCVNDENIEDFCYVVVQHAMATGQMHVAVEVLSGAGFLAASPESICKWFGMQINKRVLAQQAEMTRYVDRLEYGNAEKKKYIKKLEDQVAELRFALQKSQPQANSV
ncbi:glycosyltransferase (plasmid) [Aminobacter sp. NyZ550]|uniref:glycosyltransferase family 2 protein n=1 Tax=Aminobacter sp. NyZ550 TaxID=2979870 RepID=UPI0021D5BAC5|nr:glycosyltransferase [Aminobacter sp. NyZ550]WAX98151.1 glycosyltransferase [Aminobacter sp. NyZ550]